MKHRVYLETSVISYLTARPSRDLMIAARQAATQEWWEWYPSRMQLFISALVTEEAAKGDQAAALVRLGLLEKLATLAIDDRCRALATELIKSRALPKTEYEDALHIAVATLHGMEMIVSWNFAHLVGPTAKLRLHYSLVRLGHVAPILATPEELLESIP